MLVYMIMLDLICRAAVFRASSKTGTLSVPGRCGLGIDRVGLCSGRHGVSTRFELSRAVVVVGGELVAV
ncbi:hypothetical protein GN244_ATG02389 [Phytophthora infestans]|uniref:Secreted protein n=1 Tax=Phytophthora infestans TaxID=4787 RepID=A0A833TEY2_PHYIN|nr:hypothetical protein GN244_ATG02389 [Phytophthora infestans]KAF4135576.1 hypothetical protein GN958_ATG15233 [Phytophthora infestans]